MISEQLKESKECFDKKRKANCELPPSWVGFSWPSFNALTTFVISHRGIIKTKEKLKSKNNFNALLSIYSY